MGKIIETRISRYDGGISDDIREPVTNKFSVTKHFDVFTNPFKLIPRRDMETDETIGVDADAMRTYTVQDFLVGSNKYFYAHGSKTGGASVPKILVKTDPIAGDWTEPANAEGAAGNIINGCFVEYKNYLWGFHLNNKIFKYGDITGAATFTDQVDVVSATITTTTQGVIGPDDLLYLPYNNIICRISVAGVLSDSVLTLPTKYRITSICNYGNYLAIACCEKNIASIGQMKVYLWDRDSSLTTISDVIDFGEGNDLKIAVVDGYLVGVIKKYPNTMVFTNAGATIIKVILNNIARTVINRKENSTYTLIGGFVKDNKFYFVNNCGINVHDTEATCGIWVLCHKPDGTWGMTVDVVNDAIGATNLVNFGNFADYWWIVIGTGAIVKTNDVVPASYTFKSVYESEVFDGKIYGYDSSFTKKLIGVSVQTEKLPTDGQVILAYRKDGTIAWTTIFTNTEDDSISHEAVNIEASGVNLPQYKEIEWRIESTGGAVITGFSFKEEIILKRKY